LSRQRRQVPRARGPVGHGLALMAREYVHGPTTRCRPASRRPPVRRPGSVRSIRPARRKAAGFVLCDPGSSIPRPRSSADQSGQLLPGGSGVRVSPRVPCVRSSAAERRSLKPRRGGSSPLGRTTYHYAGVVQQDRWPPFKRRRCTFESCRRHQEHRASRTPAGPPKPRAARFDSWARYHAGVV
jgi:hypothetical protein